MILRPLLPQIPHSIMAPSCLAPIFLLTLYSTFLQPAASLCAPRNGPYHAILGSNHHSSASSANAVPPISSPSPSPHTSPSPSPSPSSLSPPSASPLDTVINTVSQAINSFQSAPLDNSLKNVCSKAKHPDICISSIRSVASNLNNMDDRTGLRELVSAIIPSIKAAKKKADNLPKELKANTVPAPPTDNPDYAGNVNPLNVCIRGLNEAIDAIETVPIYLQEGTYSGTARTNLNSFVNSIRLCTDVDTPMKDDATKIYQMYENCMSIFDSIWPETSSNYLFPGQNV